jgi:hypothetical protein
MSVLRALLALALLLASSPGRAGVVRGQVTIPADRGDAPIEGLWRVDNGVLPVVPRAIDPRVECALVLVPLKAEAPKKDDNVTVELRGLRMSPTAIAVPLGAQVDFKNEDRVPRTLYTAAPEETVVPLRPTPANATRSEKMTRPGTFLLLDDELPHVRGWLIVMPGGINVKLDEHGAFNAQVKEGRYNVKLFFRGSYVVERDIDVGKNPVELQLALPAHVAKKDAPAEAVRPESPAPATPTATDGGAKP